MKKQLRRCRTDYDDRAEPNRKAIFSIQQTLQHKNINEIQNIKSFNLKYFTLQQLDAEFASTPAIKNNPHFRAILQILTEYNQQIEAFSGQQSYEFHSKKQIMDTIMSLLRSVLLSPSVQTKFDILALTYEWITVQLNPKPVKKPKRNLAMELKQLIKNRQTIQKIEFDSKYPTQKCQNELADYKSRARTHHTDRDAPAFQLQSYLTRRIDNIQTSLSKITINSRQEQRKKKLTRAVFKQSSTIQFQSKNHKIQEENINVYSQQVNKDMKTIETMPITEAIAQPPNLQEAQRAEVFQNQEEQNNENNLQATINKSQEESSSMRVEFKIKQESNFNQIEEIQQEQKGELDPVTKAYTSQLSLHIQNKHEQQAHESVIRQIRETQKLRHKINREEDQFIKRIQAWAGTRSKFKTELARKIESSRVFFKQNQQKSREKNNWNSLRINEAIKEGKRHIGGQFAQERESKVAGLSIFSQSRPKISSARNAKSLETILKEHRQQNTCDNMLQQLHQLKQKLAKKQVYASLAVLKSSMMGPQSYQMPQLTQRTERPLLLLSNPLLHKKKKKKKVEKLGRK